jgi:hypothetical protein
MNEYEIIARWFGGGVAGIFASIVTGFVTSHIQHDSSNEFLWSLIISMGVCFCFLSFINIYLRRIICTLAGVIVASTVFSIFDILDLIRPYILNFNSHMPSFFINSIAALEIIFILLPLFVIIPIFGFMIIGVSWPVKTDE